jgi:hypothetical protein
VSCTSDVGTSMTSDMLAASSTHVALNPAGMMSMSPGS